MTAQTELQTQAPNQNATADSTITSSDQAHLLHHTFFDPTTPVKATLLICHGMSEHSGRYAKFAQFLASHGIAVATYDHLGHGKTAKQPAELGYFSDDHPVQTVLKDVVIMADALKQRHPHVPHFIMGHSMGSFIVRNVLTYHATEFAGAIIMGSADKNPMIKALIPVFTALNAAAPTQRNTWAAKTMNRQFNKQFANAISASQFAWISENTDNIKAFEADPLCGFVFTNNGYLTLFTLMDKAVNQSWYRNIPSTFPMLFVSGNNDPLGDMGKGIPKLVHRLKKSQFTQVSSRLYPNMRHEPLNETQSHMVYEDILNWLVTQTGEQNEAN